MILVGVLILVILIILASLCESGTAGYRTCYGTSGCV